MMIEDQVTWDSRWDVLSGAVDTKYTDDDVLHVELIWAFTFYRIEIAQVYISIGTLHTK